jgi:hypothetical protein
MTTAATTSNLARKPILCRTCNHHSSRGNYVWNPTTQAIEVCSHCRNPLTTNLKENQ